MAFGTLINAAKQVRAETINEGLLSLALQTKIALIATNQTNIQAINDARGAANGIATLDAGGKLLSSQIPSLAVSDHLGDVADEAAMLALTGQRGDWTTRTDEDQSYMLMGDDASVLANWKQIRSPNDGVTALRNTSGTVTGQNGTVTLSDVAFSGASADIAFSDASFTADNVSGALIEVMAKADQNASDITDVESSVTTLTTTVAGKLSASEMKNAVDLTGTIDGSNKDFTVPENFVASSLVVFFGGQALRPTKDYTVAGNVVTFNASPDYETERPFVNYIVA